MICRRYAIPRVAVITAIHAAGGGGAAAAAGPTYDVEYLSTMEHIYYADMVPNAEEAAVDPDDGLVLLSDDESDDEGAHGPSRGLSEETEVPAHRIRPRVRNILGLFGKENMEAYTEWLKLVKILVLLQPSSATWRTAD